MIPRIGTRPLRSPLIRHAEKLVPLSDTIGPILIGDMIGPILTSSKKSFRFPESFEEDGQIWTDLAVDELVRLLVHPEISLAAMMTDVTLYAV